MVFHVGIDGGFEGYVAAYNDITKETIKFKTDGIIWNDESISNVNKICEKIQATLVGEFGYACIFIPGYYTENERKEFMNNVKRIGFKKVFIINSLTKIYMECNINLKEKSKVDDIFWIFAEYDLVIYEKTKILSKIIKIFYNPQEFGITESDLLFYKVNCGTDKNPNIILLDSNYYHDCSEAVKKMFPNCKYIPYSSSLDQCEIALLKARIAVDDQDLDAEYKNCNISNFTKETIGIYVESPSGFFDEDPVLYLDAGQPLPLEKTIALPVKSILNVSRVKTIGKRKIMFWAVGECYYPEMKITPKMLKIREVSFVLKIDKNFIVSYYFVVDTLESPQRRVKNLYKQTFNIPHKVLIDNLNTNAVGIDLGMTRCCVAVNRTNGIELVAIDNDNRQLPSYVSFKEKDPICGQMVINQLEFYANESVFDIKRIIGRTIDEIEIHSSWPFEVIKNDKDKPMLRVHGYKSSIVKHPEEVTAILLKHTKQKVEEFQGKIMDEVVITIPAGFNQNQKIATHVAAELAGFKTVHLLEEPIAASIAYFIDRPIPLNFNMLLFDLGGGTLDLCIFKVVKNKLKIISIEGDSNLGGRDFDNLLFQHFQNILKSNHKVIVNDKYKYRLAQRCVEIKHVLSSEDETSLDVSDFNPDIDKFLTITRQEFEKMSAALLNRLQEVLKQTFSKTDIFSSDINKVLLVGGGCRMPMIKGLIHDTFTKAEHCCYKNPDEMVAIGAAYYSSLMLKNNSKDCSIM